MNTKQIKNGINIVFFVTQNYNEEKKITNCIYKKINILDQFLMAYYSIKNNLKNIDYNISLFHNKDKNFNEKDTEILKKLDINIISSEPDHKNIPFLCRCSALTYELPVNYSHRLILDCDIIVLNNLELDLSCDWQAMYAREGKITNDINYINKKYNFNLNLCEYDNSNLYNKYMKNGNKKLKLFPHFNAGAFLIKEELCRKFVNLYQECYNLAFDKNININHMAIQYAQSFALIKLSSNWKPFNRGINYLIPISNIDNYENFNENNIQLIHYCGISGVDRLYVFMNKYPQYKHNLLSLKQ